MSSSLLISLKTRSQLEAQQSIHETPIDTWRRAVHHNHESMHDSVTSKTSKLVFRIKTCKAYSQLLPFTGNQKTTKTMPTVLKVEWEKKATGTNEDALADAVQNLQQEGEDKIKLELKVRSRTSRQKAVEEDKQGVRTSGRLKVKSESKRQKEGAT